MEKLIEVADGFIKDNSEAYIILKKHSFIKPLENDVVVNDLVVTTVTFALREIMGVEKVHMIDIPAIPMMSPSDKESAYLYKESVKQVVFIDQRKAIMVAKLRGNK